jgi:hypothetical protein
MALVRRDEPAIQQLSTDGSCNVCITLSITPGRYTKEERMAFLQSPTERQKVRRAIHPYLGTYPSCQRDSVLVLRTQAGRNKMERTKS